MICGLDITPAALRLAIVEQRGNRIGVDRLLLEPRNQAGTITEQIDAIATTHRVRWDELHLAIAGQHATHRILTLPFGGRAQLDAAVPSAMRALVPFPLQDGAVAYEVLHSDAHSASVCAALCAPDALARLVDGLGTDDVRLRSVRYAPLAVASLVGPALSGQPCAAFVDLTAATPTLLLFRAGKLASLRVLAWQPGSPAQQLSDELRWSLAIGGADEQTAFVLAASPGMEGHRLEADLQQTFRTRVLRFEELELAGMPATWRPVQQEFATALGLAVGATRTPGSLGSFPLRSGGARAAPSLAMRREIRRAGALVTAALALLLAHATTRHVVVRHRLAEIEQTLTSELRSVSDDRDAPRTVHDLEVRVRSLRDELSTGARTRASHLDLLREISRRATGVSDIVVDDLAMDSTEARLMGHAADFGSIASLERALAGSALFEQVTMTQSAASEGTVSFRMVLTLAPQRSDQSDQVES